MTGLVAGLAMLLYGAGPAIAASHREAPLTAIDRTADITDWYAFVSPENPSTVTLILCVDPLLEPGNGPNYFPFDDNVLYRLLVDNNRDARPDLAFEVRFTTDVRLDDVPVGFIGAGNGLGGVIPPAITSLTSTGLSLRQSYRVTLRKGDKTTELKRQGGGRLLAVPSNVGPRTMPNYRNLYRQGIYTLDQNIKVFAGTTDDGFYIDLGAAFDSLNLRRPVLSDAQDKAKANLTADEVAGYNVNTIALQVPISLLVQGGGRPPSSDAKAVIGTWGATFRQQTERRDPRQPIKGSGAWVQVQRMGNPLFNELIIGTGFKDRWSRSEPKDDAAFARFALDPVIAQAAKVAFGLTIPAAPRNDLLPLVTYAPPIAPAGGNAGPVADLLRLNTGVAPKAFAAANRLGLLGGDAAGFPNGRRPLDDVTDIALRVVVGGVLKEGFDRKPNNRLGDGVNANDRAYEASFPYLPPANDGRNSRHVDPGEPGCAGGACPIN